MAIPTGEELTQEQKMRGFTFPQQNISHGDLTILPEHMRRPDLIVVNEIFKGESSIKASLEECLTGDSRIFAEDNIGCPWVQDHFDIAYSSEFGNPVAIFPLGSEYAAYYNFLKEKRWGVDREGKDRRFDIPAIEAPYDFDGGNIIQDAVRGKTVLFVGVDTFSKKMNEGRSDQDILKDMKRIYGVDEVVVIGKELGSQPSEMFHIDQVMLPIGSGRVALANIWGSRKDEIEMQIKEMVSYRLYADYFKEHPHKKRRRGCISEVEKQIRPELRKQRDNYWGMIDDARSYINCVGRQLSELGYYTVPLNIDARHLFSYQSFACSMIFMADPERALRGVVTNAFPDYHGRYEMDDLNRSNAEIFDRNGIRTWVIPEDYFSREGNTHCTLKHMALSFPTERQVRLYNR